MHQRRFVSTTAGVTFSQTGELQWNGSPTEATEVLAAVRDVLHRLAPKRREMSESAKPV